MSRLRRPADKNVADALNNIDKRLSELERVSQSQTEPYLSGDKLSGYTELQGGIILQWGYVEISPTGSTTVVFIKEFPNACLNITATAYDIDDVSGNSVAPGVHTLPTTTQVIFSAASYWEGMYWLAIGY